MTMRIRITNADETGRVARIILEERNALETSWRQQQDAYLKDGESREFHIYAGSRLTVTEDPSATVARP